MVAKLHPSQKRLSCETCRNHKLRCLRDNSDGLRCSRCARLGIACVPGQQRRVGRPRRQAAAGRLRSGQDSSISVEASIGGMETPEFETWPSLALGSGVDSGDYVGFSWDQAFYPTPTTVNNLEEAGNASAAATAECPSETPGASMLWEVDTDLFSIPSLSIATPACRSSGGRPPHESASGTATPSEDGCFGVDIRESLPSTRAITSHQAVSKLSKLAIDIHARTVVAEAYHKNIELHDIVCDNTIFHIDNLCLVEFVLRASQDFLGVLTGLRMSLHIRGLLSVPPQPTDMPCSKSAPPARLVGDVPANDNGQAPAASIDPSATTVSQPLPPPTPSGTPQDVLSMPSPTELISAPLALTITSIYIQLISLYEIILMTTNAHLDSLWLQPLEAVSGVQFAGVPLTDSNMQGMVLSQIVVSLLERTERCLGIGMVPAGAAPGLFSKRQQDVLWHELDTVGGGDHGPRRPARLREGFERTRKAFVEASRF